MSRDIVGGIGLAGALGGGATGAEAAAMGQIGQGPSTERQREWRNYAANQLKSADYAFRAAFHPTPVRAFHEAFGHPVSYDPTYVPEIGLRLLRLRMLGEELMELARAMGCQIKLLSGMAEIDDRVDVEAVHSLGYDVVEVADGLGDLRYIIDGGNLICGIPGEIVFYEIHFSNMSKLGEDGKPVVRADGKILKGPNYWKPNIRKILFGDK